MAPHTLTTAIMSRSTARVSEKSTQRMPSTNGSTTRQQNPRFCHCPDARKVIKPQTSIADISYRSRALLDRSLLNRFPSLHQVNSFNLHPRLFLTPMTPIAHHHYLDSNSSRQDPASTRRKKPLPVVCERRRRKDADFSKGSLTATKMLFVNNTFATKMLYRKITI